MSACNPCDPCPPTDPVILDLVDSLKYVGGWTDKGRAQQLNRKKNALLYSGDGSVAVWATGEDEIGERIKTPNFAEFSTPAGSVMVQDTSGRWYRLVPPDDITGRATLVSEAGSVYFAELSEAQLTFLASKVRDADCGFDFAVWPRCEGNLKTTLSKTPYASVVTKILASIGEQVCSGDDVAEPDSMIVCKDGALGRVPIPTAGMHFYPEPSITFVFNSVNAGGGTLTLPNYPADKGGKVWGHFYVDVQIDAGEGANGIMELTLDGTLVARFGPYAEWTQYVFAKTSVASPTLTLGLTGIVSYQVTFRHIGYSY